MIVEDAPAFSGLSGLFPTFTDPLELYRLLQQMKADRAFLQRSARRGYILAKRRRGQRPVLARHLAWYRGWKVPASGLTLEFARKSQQEMVFIRVFYDKVASKQARLICKPAGPTICQRAGWWIGPALAARQTWRNWC